jgi:hypothetical protein
MLLKHFICEFVLQTDKMAESKKYYGSWLSLQHILHHAFGTMVIMLLFHIDPIVALTAILIEAVLHYHIDWTHMRFGSQSYRDKRYWQWLGAEQLAHQLTIIVIMIFLIQFSDIVLDIYF